MRLVSSAFLLALVTCAAGPPADLTLALKPSAPPKGPRIAAPTYVRQGTTFTQSFVVRLQNDPNGAVDTLIIANSATGQPTQLRRIAAQASQTVSFTWNAPVQGQTLNGTITAQAKRAGVAASVPGALSSTASRQWSYTAPVIPPPPPIIDTALVIGALDVKPDTARVVSGQQVQFCGFIEFATHVKAMRTQDAATCSAEWNKLPLSQRIITSAQQARADSVCLTWTAEGGTITNEVCPPPGGDAESTERTGLSGKIEKLWDWLVTPPNKREVAVAPRVRLVDRPLRDEVIIVITDKKPVVLSGVTKL